MYTQCPHCQTIFGVSDAHLSAAFGRVRCGQCHGQFNAKRHLLDALPDQAIESESPPEVDSSPANEAPIETLTDDSKLEIPDTIPNEDMDYIDLSAPAEPTRPEEPPTEITLDASTSLTVEPDVQPPSSKPHEALENSELDAIFAALDHRLEELSEDSNAPVIKPFEAFETEDSHDKDYSDAFGDPDSQTEDDIKASIEQIFAAAEAELNQPDGAAETMEEADILPDELPDTDTGIDLDLPTLAEQDITEDNSGEDQSEDIVITAPNDGFEDFDLSDQTADLGSVVDIESQDTNPENTPLFEQEELPFILQPDLTATPPPRHWGKTVFQTIFIFLLVAGIGFQLALFRNIELAHKVPALKPYLVQFCEFLPCQFIGQRDVKQIHLTSRDVRTHPKGKNTILISAIFVNSAHFDQPFPDIQLTLSDLTTTVVAQRRFSPADYLARQNSAFELMRSGQPIHITLEVLDPGNDAVNFQFEFL